MSNTAYQSASEFGYSHQKLRVSDYDKLSGLLLASIAIFGALFLILLACLWQPPSIRVIFPPPPGEHLIITELDSNDTLDAGAEFPEVQPIVDARVFEQVTDVVTSFKATTAFSKDGSGDVVGTGDGRGIGAGILPSPAGTPPHSRWNITYQLSDKETYSAQLRHFKVQLILVHKSKDLVYRISDVGKSNLVRESNRASESRTSFFASRNKRMAKWDQSFAHDAITESGEGVSGYIFVHMISDQFFASLQASEKAHLPMGKTTGDIVKTHFKIISAGKDEFRIEVTGIDFN